MKIENVVQATTSNLQLSTFNFQLSTKYETTPVSYTHLDVYKRQIIDSSNGPIYQRILLQGKSPGTDEAFGVNLEIKLYHDTKRIELEYAIKRLSLIHISGYAQMRYSNGEWEKNFDPFKSGANHHYVEGNAWQLTFFVPQDVPALTEIIGKERFIDRLSWGFKASEPWRYNAPGDQYWDFPVVQGNQQSMHFAFLFNWAGQPWQTQQWSRSIIDRYYGFDTSNAYLGDEDVYKRQVSACSPGTRRSARYHR